MTDERVDEQTPPGDSAVDAHGTVGGHSDVGARCHVPLRDDSDCRHRRSIRLRGYDYTQAGAYFVTICTQDRACLFGEIIDGQMRLNDRGAMVHQEWINLPHRFPNIDLDAFIVMPNHIHGIIVITDVDPVGAGLVPALPSAPNEEGVTISGASGATRATTRVAPTAGGTVGAFKSITTVRYTHGVKHYGRLWQRNYYEHIIRNIGRHARACYRNR